MINFLKVGIIFLISFSLLSCFAHRSQNNIDVNFAHETWRYQVETRPIRWERGADRWFWTGEPNRTEWQKRRAPYKAAINMMRVNVPNFTKISVQGNFQLQLYGTNGPNCVYVSGPNEAVDAAILKVSKDTLCILERKGASANTNQVIIRIGIHELNRLVQMGCGSIEGVFVHSRALSILTTPQSGNRIYLAGDMRLTQIEHYGRGSLNIFGANTSNLDIIAAGCGEVNICGNVGVRSIRHRSTDNVNIIGAKSLQLDIFAEGNGKIGISGPVRLRLVTVSNHDHVYLTDVRSPAVYATLRDKAELGLAGYAGLLEARACNESVFFGRYLCTRNAHVRTYQLAHANINSAHAVAQANGASSIFFYGAESRLTAFNSRAAVVLPVAPLDRCCQAFYPRQVVKVKPCNLVQFRGAG